LKVGFGQSQLLIADEISVMFGDNAERLMDCVLLGSVELHVLGLHHGALRDASLELVVCPFGLGDVVVSGLRAVK
jgi:hypothetical protein